MVEFTHSERQTFAKKQVPTWDNTSGMRFDIMLVCIKINKHGDNLCKDPLNRIVVMMEDIATPIDNVVWGQLRKL